MTSRLINNHLKDWNVSSDYSGSDHRIISFDLSSTKVIPTTFRNRRKVRWNKFKKIFIDKANNANFTSKSIEELDHAAENLREILIGTFEESCKLVAVKDKFYMNWYNNKLHEEKKVVRKWYRKATNKKNCINARNKSWKLYVDKNKTYVRNCFKAKNNNWKNNATNLENIKDISRLQKLMENSHKNKIGSLRRSDGSYTCSSEESIKLLMETNFPECSILNGELPSNFLNKESDQKDWNNIEKIIDDEKIKWAVESLKPYKAPGEDGIFPALLHHVIDHVVPILKKLFRSSLRLGYIPNTWRGTYIAFIPKPGKSSYEEAKSFRPISLMSFILKILEKLIDKHIREESLKNTPLNKAQHAYQKSKGTESALHAFVSRHEHFTVDKKIKSITVFIDIEGAFDNTGYDVIMKEAKNKGVKDWIVNWIESMLKSRRIKAQGNESSIEYNPTRGCPQGGCLSPLLWCLVVDDLINKLEKEGLHVIAYADDLAITATAANSKMNLTTVIEKINRGMKIVEEWCAVSGLNVNPSKSCFMRFSPGTPRNETKININLFQQEIKQVKQFKYLGVIIDENLRWTAHVD